MNESILIIDTPYSCSECQFLIRDEDDYPECSITKDKQGYFFEYHKKKMNSCPLEYLHDY